VETAQKPKKRGLISMTPFQEHLAKQASTEMDSTKLLVLIDELCGAIDSEIEDNRLLRLGCKWDCKEHGHVYPLPAALPENVKGAVECC
jgi:hypothetical protein